MRAFLSLLSFIAVLILIFGIGIADYLYSYHDCMRVGHTKLYCIIHP